jgi:hypothetical protein
MTIAGRQGMSENNDFGEKPTPPKTDSSSSLCINLGSFFFLETLYADF